MNNPGYADGDLTFEADKWNGAANDGEFTVDGTYFVNNGATYTTSYDAAGNVLTETDPLGNVTEYVRDNLHRLTSRTNANDETTSYTYDAVGNRLSIIDPEQNTTTFGYDRLNRMITETNQLDDARHFEYDPAGNLIERTDRNERVTEYVYDNLNRRTEERWKDGETTVRTIAFDYDDAGQMFSVDDPDAEYTYAYNELGLIESITHDIAGLVPDVIMTQLYDAAGQRKQLAAVVGADDDFVNQYYYGVLGITRIDQSGVDGGNAVAEKRFDFAYDNGGQRDTISRYADLAGTALVAQTDYTFDLAGRLTELAHTKDQTTLAGYEWTYDNACPY